MHSTAAGLAGAVTRRTVSPEWKTVHRRDQLHNLNDTTHNNNINYQLKIDNNKPCVLDNQVDLEHALNIFQCVHSQQSG